ncbi:MAG: glutamine-hydrolyzing carbamoyl-phosphate synthase small subunit [Planctomycetota bacterium]|jgi:carbamoyl-phosphate synthase small subunit
MNGCLALEDGRIFFGRSFGAEGKSSGEIVFNTSMTGYQEIITDPSYNGQIITMTYPLIGNYGINPEDIESDKLACKGFVVREYCHFPSNFRSTMNLSEYLIKNNIVALSDIDTRAITKHIRQAGAMKSVIAAGDYDPQSLVEEAKNSQGLVGRDLVCEVTCGEQSSWTEPCSWVPLNKRADRKYKVVAMDFGMKHNIPRCLVSYGCEVTIVPASTKADDILKLNPDGIFLSNGPGDPEAVMYAVDEIKKLLGKKPMFGICLGHQLLSLAFGGKTYKLKFGHRGANQPVKNLATNKVEITSQNHGFCVDMDSLKDKGIEVTHVNLNDNTVEGIENKELQVFSVQYHPEASAGPHDAEYLFGKFMEMMKANA